MHPVFEKKRRRSQVVGYAAISTGLVGFALPFLPGFLFWLVGLSLLSFNSPRLRFYTARARARYPHLAAPFAALEEKLVKFFDLGTHTYELQGIPVRNGHTLSAILERSIVLHAPLAIVLHAASGTKETPATTAIAEGLRARGYTVLRFDAYDGLGDSGGAYPSFTASRYFEDLVDVVSWARSQSWCLGTLILAGHSIGGTVAMRYASEHGDEVERMVLYAPTLSGEALERSYREHEPDMLAQWRATGSREIVHPRTDEVHVQDLSFLEDLKRYDCMRWIAQFTMPVELFCGTHDILTDVSMYAAFTEAVGPNARLYTLDDLDHIPIHHIALHRLTQAIAHA